MSQRLSQKHLTNQPNCHILIHDPDATHKSYGMLAGSALTLNTAMANVLQWIDAETCDIWQMGTSTPARIVGLTNKGRVKVGCDADFVLWNDDLTPCATWICGRCEFCG